MLGGNLSHVLSGVGPYFFSRDGFLCGLVSGGIWAGQGLKPARIELGKFPRKLPWPRTTGSCGENRVARFVIGAYSGLVLGLPTDFKGDSGASTYSDPFHTFPRALLLLSRLCLGGTRRLEKRMLVFVLTFLSFL